jgi:hypothetical protein
VERYNIVDIAGKYLFYILKPSSYLNFNEIMKGLAGEQSTLASVAKS